MGLDPLHLSSFRDDWMPQLQTAVSEVRATCTNQHGVLDKPAFVAGLGNRNIQDGYWEWDRKWDLLQNDLSKVFFAVECDGAAQALMVVDNSKYVCRHDDHSGSGLIYIEFVAVAPWNRGALVTDPTYGGLGKVLVGTAVSLSIEEEFAGRIGLHSLPQSEGFYTNGCGMTDFGPDAGKEGLNYFEMTETQATVFLGDE